MAETLKNVQVYWGTAHLYSAPTGTLDGRVLTLTNPHAETTLKGEGDHDVHSGKVKLTVKAKQTVQAQRSRATTSAAQHGAWTDEKRGPAGTVDAPWEHAMKVQSWKDHTLKLVQI